MKRAAGVHTVTALGLVLLLVLCHTLPAAALDLPRWSEVYDVSENITAGGVGTGIDDRERINIVWTEGDGPYDVYFQRMNLDNGIINKKHRVGETGIDSFIDCAATPDNGCVILFLDLNGIMFTRVSRAGINTVSEMALVSSSGVTDMRFTVDDEGNIHTVYGKDGALYYIQADELGEVATAETRISANGSQPDIALNARGEIIVSFLDADANEIVLNRYSPDLQLISNKSLSVGSHLVSFPRMALEASGETLLFWTEDREGAPSTLMLSRLNEDGSIVIVNKELFHNVYLMHPFSVSVDSGGKVHLLWYSQEDGWKLNYGLLNRNGEMLTAPMWIAEFDKPRTSGPGFDLAADADGNAHLVWSKGGINYMDSRPEPGEDDGPLSAKETMALAVLLVTVIWLFVVNRWVLGMRKRDVRRLDLLNILEQKRKNKGSNK